MGRQLSRMTSAELKAEMSIAGDPDKIMAIGSDMLTCMKRMDATNAAELINMTLMLDRLKAEVKQLMRIYHARTGQKIK